MNGAESDAVTNGRTEFKTDFVRNSSSIGKNKSCAPGGIVQGGTESTGERCKFVVSPDYITLFVWKYCRNRLAIYPDG